MIIKKRLSKSLVSVKEYYMNGNIKAIYKLKCGRPYGDSMHFYENGSTRWIIHRNKFDEVRTIYYYKTGKIHGIFSPELYKSFYRNESLYCMFYHKNNIIDGECIDYWDNGNKMIIRMYKNNLLEGKCETFHKNENLDKLYYNKNNLKHGVYKKFYSNGQLAEIGKYKNGKKDGKWVLLFTDGDVKSIENYINGNMSGNSYYFYGDNISIYKYVDGFMYSYFIKDNYTTERFFYRREYNENLNYNGEYISISKHSLCKKPLNNMNRRIYYPSGKIKMIVWTRNNLYYYKEYYENRKTIKLSFGDTNSLEEYKYTLDHIRISIIGTHDEYHESFMISFRDNYRDCSIIIDFF